VLTSLLAIAADESLSLSSAPARRHVERL